MGQNLTRDSTMVPRKILDNFKLSWTNLEEKCLNTEYQIYLVKMIEYNNRTQGHSMRIFVRKMPQRCGVWQIKPMASVDQDPLSTKSNNSGFGSYSQMKV